MDLNPWKLSFGRKCREEFTGPETFMLGPGHIFNSSLEMKPGKSPNLMSRVYNLMGVRGLYIKLHRWNGYAFLNSTLSSVGTPETREGCRRIVEWKVGVGLSETDWNISCIHFVVMYTWDGPATVSSFSRCCRSMVSPATSHGRGAFRVLTAFILKILMIAVELSNGEAIANNLVRGYFLWSFS